MDYLNYYEVAKQLKVSHTTIYNRLKDENIYEELKPHIKKIKNVMCIDNQGIELLKKYVTSKEINNKKDVNFTEGMKNLQINFITNLQEQNKQLQNQIEEKDKQLNAKDELLRNFQILLKNEQENIKLLKDSNDKKTTTINSIWNKLFGKEK
jgi:hypothetical protein